MALELRPTCENCNIALPPDSLSARICSYECTFCDACVHELGNVCPNCGGAFERRPIRPATEWMPGLSIAKRPPATRATHQPVDRAAHAALSARVAHLAPEKR